MSAECGIGMRIGNTLSGQQRIRCGLFDAANGVYFFINSSGINVAVSRDGVETVIPSSNFNVDKLDGTGPSNVTWNPLQGYVYAIHSSWYGYGVIEFGIFAGTSSSSEQKLIVCHRYYNTSSTSLKNPNLNISVSLENQATTALAQVFVSGRHFSIWGNYTPIYRSNSTYRLAASVNSTTTFIPILSIKRKPGYDGNCVRIHSLDFSATSDVLVQVRVKTALTGANFVNLPDQDVNESIVLSDSTATAISTPGIIIWTGLIPNDKSALRQIDQINVVVSEQDIVTVCAKALSITNGSLTCVFRWVEEW